MKAGRRCIAGMAAEAARLDRVTLRLLRPAGRAVRWRLEHPAAPPVATPRQALPRPLHCDWNWRPAPWADGPAALLCAAAGKATEIATGVTLYHEGLVPAGTGWQVDEQPGGPAPFALRLEAPGLGGGGFVSLAIALPDAATQGLRPDHILALHLRLSGLPGAVARLNLRHGPNLAELQLPVGLAAAGDAGGAVLEFDLAACTFAAVATTHIWCDLILAEPAPQGIIIHELAFARYPRAPL